MNAATGDEVTGVIPPEGNGSDAGGVERDLFARGGWV